MDVFNKDVILLSSSPRRKQILENMGFSVKVRLNHTDETYPSELSPEKTVTFLAKKKNDSYKDAVQKNEVLIAADTIVTFNDKILGKPVDYGQAFDMLHSLSGQKHKVLTGCCIRDNKKEVCFFETTYVWFNSLKEEEISYYINTEQPFDKAGAYGIQEWIGMIGINRIEGDFYNVMGLPAHRIWRELSQNFTEKYILN